MTTKLTNKDFAKIGRHIYESSVYIERQYFAKWLNKIVKYTGCNEPHGEYTIMLDDFERLKYHLERGEAPWDEDGNIL